MHTSGPFPAYAAHVAIPHAIQDTTKPQPQGVAKPQLLQQPEPASAQPAVDSQQRLGQQAHVCATLQASPQEEAQKHSLVEQQGVLLPSPSGPFWTPTFCGNVPYTWWQQECSTHAELKASASRITSWDELCSSSSAIQQQFQFLHSMMSKDYPPLSEQRPCGHYMPGVGVNRSSRAYTRQLFRQPVFSNSSKLRSAPARYIHRQIIKAATQEAARTRQLLALSSLLSQLHSPHQQQRHPKQRRRRKLLAHQQQQLRQQLQQQSSSSGYSPSWPQLVLERQQRCRLRSHGSSAATAAASSRARRLRQLCGPTFPEDESSQTWKEWSRETWVQTPPSWALEAAAAAAAGPTAAAPSGSEAAVVPAPRSCVARRDEHGNLIPLPAGCLAGGCSSGSGPPAASRDEYSSDITSSSACVAGIGCDYAELKKAAETARQIMLKSRGSVPFVMTLTTADGTGRGRRRRLWSQGWLWGARTPPVKQHPAEPVPQTVSRGVDFAAVVTAAHITIDFAAGSGGASAAAGSGDIAAAGAGAADVAAAATAAAVDSTVGERDWHYEEEEESAGSGFDVGASWCPQCLLQPADFVGSSQPAQWQQQQRFSDNPPVKCDSCGAQRWPVMVGWKPCSSHNSSSSSSSCEFLDSGTAGSPAEDAASAAAAAAAKPPPGEVYTGREYIRLLGVPLLDTPMWGPPAAAACSSFPSPSPPPPCDSPPPSCDIDSDPEDDYEDDYEEGCEVHDELEEHDGYEDEREPGFREYAEDPPHYVGGRVHEAAVDADEERSKFAFRNERNIIYGFWSKCPLG